METDLPADYLKKLAKIIAIIFHPILMPLYGMAIIFTAPTLLGYIPAEIKKLLLLIVLINNVLLPLSLIPFFIQRKIISSWALRLRKDRKFPLIIATILYGATSYIIFKFPIPLFLKSFIFASAFLSLIVTITNFWWKISLHAVGVGALAGLVVVLSVKMISSLDVYLISVIITGGLVLFSRLKLNLHNPLEVWIGYFTGALGLVLFMTAV